MSKQKPSARGAAISLLDQVLGEKRLLSDVLSGDSLDGLSPPDRARAQRLSTQTLRGLERVDRLISRHVRKPPHLHVRNALRLACYELCTGGDAHGVVGEIVGLIGADRRYMRYKSLTNAVLRQIAETGEKSWQDMRIPRLTDWLRRRLVKIYGAGVVNAIEAVHFVGAPLDLTLRREEDHTLVADLDAVKLPTGTLRLHHSAQVSTLPGYEAGAWWVQDAAAALPVQLLNPQHGETILDLCAAPGGKTMQLAAVGAAVTALDISEGRMRRVRENLTRTALPANCVVEDALTHAGGPYDAILLDAPCSATGTIRRHPDLPFIKNDRDLESLIALQAHMLDHALSLLQPAGRLVFCTCSLLPEEGELQIKTALERHNTISIDTNARQIPGVATEWFTAEGGIRLRPDYWREQGGMDGFYMACLRKTA